MSKNQILFIDTETTGLNPDRHEIIELALVTSDFEVLFNRRIRPAYPEQCTPEAAAVNGFTHDEWKEEPHFDEVEVADTIASIMQRYGCIGGQNTQFDMHFLQSEYKRMNARFPNNVIKPPRSYKWLDLYTLAHTLLYPQVTKSLSLAGISEALGIENEAPHTALGDAMCTAKCYMYLQNAAKTGILI